MPHSLFVNRMHGARLFSHRKTSFGGSQNSMKRIESNRIGTLQPRHETDPTSQTTPTHLPQIDCATQRASIDPLHPTNKARTYLRASSSMSSGISSMSQNWFGKSASVSLATMGPRVPHGAPDVVHHDERAVVLVAYLAGLEVGWRERRGLVRGGEGPHRRKVDLLGVGSAMGGSGVIGATYSMYVHGRWGQTRRRGCVRY